MRLSTCSCLAYKDKIYCQLEMQEQKSRYVGRSSKDEYFEIEKNALATWLQRKRKHKTYNTGHILSCKSHRTCIFPSQSFVHPESTANSCCSHNPAWVVNWKCKSSCTVVVCTIEFLLFPHGRMSVLISRTRV